MRFGINTFLFTSPFTNESTKLFKDYRAWGFDSVEIPIEHPSHIDPAFVKSELAKQGLVCGSLCGAFGPDRDLRGTPEQQKASTDYILYLIDAAVALDCPTVAGPLYSAVGRAGFVPDKERKVQWKLVVKNLKKISKYALKKGVTLAVEPAKITSGHHASATVLTHHGALHAEPVLSRKTTRELLPFQVTLFDSRHTA